MSAPNRYHQTISGNFFLKFGNYLYGKQCKIFSAPFDVRLPKNGKKNDKEIFNVVQPDIVIVCDPAKLDDKGCIGAPDLIVEITSKSTAKNDMKYKFELYERTGVNEYWIAFPEYKTIQVFVLGENDKYQIKGSYAEGDKISPTLFPDLSIDVDDIFRE